MRVADAAGGEVEAESPPSPQPETPVGTSAAAQARSVDLMLNFLTVHAQKILDPLPRIKALIQARRLRSWRPNGLDRSEPLDRIRIPFDGIDQQRGLGIRSGAALFPVFERANVCPQIDGKQGA